MIISDISEPSMAVHGLTDQQRQDIRFAVESYWCMQIGILKLDPPLTLLAWHNTNGYLALVAKP